MGLQKPQKSKAPAPTLDQSVFVNAGVNDPCCIPISVGPLLANSTDGGDMGHTANGDAVGHILNPTAH